MIEKIKGYKTYVISVAMVAFGIAGLIIGELDANNALLIVLNGLGMGSVRNAIN